MTGQWRFRYLTLWRSPSDRTWWASYRGEYLIVHTSFDRNRQCIAWGEL